MHKITRSTVLLITVVVLSACIPFPSPLTPTSGTPATPGDLQLSKSASTQTYSQAGQIVTYTYLISNSGTAPLGPTQFTISDSRLGAPFPCGPAVTTLASHQSLSCSASYTVTQADMNLPELTNSATAAGAGKTSTPVSVTIVNLTLSGTQLVPGMTVQHQVMEGEWLSQIVRCYGANLSAVLSANPGITNPKATLPPRKTLTIPSIGSDASVHGPPCLFHHTVEAGDTWESIASRYFVDVVVLQDANRDVTLTNGARLRVPLYSPDHSPYPPGYDSVTARRIEVPVGGSPLTLVGVVAPSSRVWYVVTLPETHILSLKLTGVLEALALAVYDTDGEPHNPFGKPMTWTAFIPATGDYYIKVSEVRGAGAEPYTLEASLAPTPLPTPPPSETGQP